MRKKPERSMGRPQAACVAAGVTIFCAGMLLLSAPVAQAQVKEYGVSELASLALARSSESLSARSSLAESSASLEAAKRTKLPVLSIDTQASWIGIPTDALVIEEGSFGSIPYTPSPGTTIYIALPDNNVTIFEEQDPFYFSTTLSLVQPIWTWGKLDNAIAAQSVRKELTAANVTKSDTDVLCALYSSLYAIRYQSEALVIVREQADLARRMLLSAAASRDAGFLTELDYEKSSIDAEQLLRTASQLQDSIDSIKRDIADYAGIPASEEWTVRISGLIETPVVSEKSIEEWITLAMGSNHDIALAGLAMKLDESLLRLAESNQAGKPDLGLSVRGGWKGSRFPPAEDWEDKSDWFLTVTLGLQGDLFDFGSSAWKAQAAEAAARKAGLDDERARRSVEKATRSLYALLASYREDIEYAQRKEKHAEAMVEDSRMKREAGTVGEPAVFSAQTEQLSALLELTRLRMDYANACIRFLSITTPYEILSGSAFTLSPSPEEL